MCQRIGRLLTGPSLRTYRLVSRYSTGIEAKARTRPTRRPGLQVTRPDRRTRAARTAPTDTRAAILDAAARVVAERGLRDASIDEIAALAGCSKGAVYWHFDSKDDLFFALLEDRVDRPTYEMIELLQSAPAGQDMGPEASRRFVELLRSERDLLLLHDEYWSRAMRDPSVRRRYIERQAGLRAAIGNALATRMEHLGAQTDPMAADVMATAVMALGVGLARERLMEPDAVPDDLLGRLIVLLYKGLVADAAGR